MNPSSAALAIKAAIVSRFGFFPPFFEPAMSSASVIDNLWNQTVSAYLDNPLPTLFKEKLAALLARHCAVSYCLICHSAALKSLGMSGTEVYDLLARAVPDFEEGIRRPSTDPDPTRCGWLVAGSSAEDEVLQECVAVHLGHADAHVYERLKKTVGTSSYNEIISFLAYNKTALTWAEAHPEISYENDRRAMEHLVPLLESDSRLSTFFENYSAQYAVLETQQLARRHLQNTEARHKDAIEFLQLALDGGQMGTWSIDLASEEVTLSDSTIRLMGYLPGQAEAAGILFDSIHPEDRALVQEAWRKAIANREPYSVEYRIVHPDGQVRWLFARGNIRANPFGDGEILAGINGDISDRKEAENAIAAQKQELESMVHRLEEEADLKERFVAMLSHDLRTPLTTAKLSAQLLARQVPDLETQRKVAGRITQNMNRADRMIRDLLDATQIKAGKKPHLDLQDCDLNRIVKDTLEDLSSVHGNRFSVVTAGDVTGSWDAEALRRSLENLVGNAVKYGAVDAPITLTLVAEPEHIEVGVHNFGNEIAIEEQASLFEPYRRTQSAVREGKKGWGLGLSLVRGLVDAHGGSVRIRSVPGEGTTFTVRLPRDSRNAQ